MYPVVHFNPIRDPVEGAMNGSHKEKVRGRKSIRKQWSECADAQGPAGRSLAST